MPSIVPIENINKVIDIATKDGANLVGGTNFTFSDDLQKSLEQKATELAVKDAKEKAQNLATAAGIHLGKVTNVVSSSGGFGVAMPMALEARKADTVSSAPTQVTPGQSTVSVNVTIFYETF